MWQCPLLDECWMKDIKYKQKQEPESMTPPGLNQALSGVDLNILEHNRWDQNQFVCCDSTASPGNSDTVSQSVLPCRRSRCTASPPPQTLSFSEHDFIDLWPFSLSLCSSGRSLWRNTETGGTAMFAASSSTQSKTRWTWGSEMICFITQWFFIPNRNLTAVPDLSKCPSLREVWLNNNKVELWRDAGFVFRCKMRQNLFSSLDSQIRELNRHSFQCCLTELYLQDNYIKSIAGDSFLSVPVKNVKKMWICCLENWDEHIKREDRSYHQPNSMYAWFNFWWIEILALLYYPLHHHA